MNLGKFTEYRGKNAIHINLDKIVSLAECFSQKDYETEATYYVTIQCEGGLKYEVLGRLDDVIQQINGDDIAYGIPQYKDTYSSYPSSYPA